MAETKQHARPYAQSFSDEPFLNRVSQGNPVRWRATTTGKGLREERNPGGSRLWFLSWWGLIGVTARTQPGTYKDLPSIYRVCWRLIECRPVGVGVGVRSHLVGHALGIDQHRAGLNIVINLPRTLVADQ